MKSREICYFGLLKDRKGLTDHFMDVKETRNLPGLLIYSCLKHGAFTAVKMDAAFLLKWLLSEKGSTCQ